MILRPRIEGDPASGSRYYRYAMQLAYWFDRWKYPFSQLKRRADDGTEIIILRSGRFVIPVIKAVQIVTQYGFLCTPRQGSVQFTYGSTGSHTYRDPDEHDGDYDRTVPYINNLGYVPPYTDEGVGTPYADLYTFWGGGRGYTRLAVYPHYGNNPAVRLFAPKSADEAAFTTLDRVHNNFGQVDWKGPDGLALSWYGPRSRLVWQNPVWSYSIFYRGEILAVAPGKVYGACVRKITGGYELIAAVNRVSSNRIEFWKKALQPRAESPSERQTMDLINDLRYQEGYVPFWIYGGDKNVAREWSESMAESGTLEHGDTEGRLSELDVGGEPLLTKENIYRGSFGEDSPEAAVDWWVNSPGHFANIIDEDIYYDGMDYSILGISTQLDDNQHRYYTHDWIVFGQGSNDGGAWELMGYLETSEIAEGQIARVSFNSSGTQAVIADGNLITVDLGDTSISYSIADHPINYLYQDADFRGDTPIHAKFHLDGSGLLFAESTYETDWVTLPVNWIYIEHIDLRHRLVIWTEFRNGTITKMNHNGTVTTLYSSDVQLTPYNNDILRTYIGDSANRVNVAVNHDGVALVSAILTNNPLGALRDAAQLYPTSLLSASALNEGYLRIINGTPLKFISTGGGNFDLVGNTSANSPYPFSSSALPDYQVINLLSNGEEPIEILRVPDAESGEETVLFPLGYRGADNNLLSQPIFYNEVKVS